MSTDPKSLPSSTINPDGEISEVIYKAVLDTLPVGVAVLDRDFTVKSVNQTVRDWFPGADFGSGQRCRTIFHGLEDHAYCDNCPVLRAFADGLCHSTVHRSLGLEGTLWVQITARPIIAANGIIESVVEVIEDISDQPSLPNRLRQTYRLQDADARQSGASVPDCEKDVAVYAAFVRIMEEGKLYADPTLTLAAAAHAIGSNRSTLSRILNSRNTGGFTMVLNRYRLEAFKQEAYSALSQLYTVEALALSVGFPSRSSFFRIFRTLEGCTTGQWLKKYLP